MATIGNLVDKTRRLLTGTGRAERNTLAAPVGLADTTVTLTYPIDTLGRGSFLSVDSELMYVWATTPGSLVVTVARGELGTTVATHTTGTLIEINPRFPRAFILDALREEVAAWPASVFTTTTLELGVPASVRAIDLVGVPTDRPVYDIIKVLVNPSAYSRALAWAQAPAWRLERLQDVTAFPSGFSLTVLVSSPLSFGGAGVFKGLEARTVIATLACGFATTTWTEATDIATVGINDQFLDIAPLGAAAKLLLSREILRTDATRQGEARAAADVPSLEIVRAAEEMMKLRDTRLTEEAARLRRLWPLAGV